MAELIRADNLSLGWLLGMEYLLQQRGGKTINLSVVIERAGEEDAGVREVLDRFLAERRGKDVSPISTVANTIFPQSLYLPKLGDKAQSHLYEMYRVGYPVRRRCPGNEHGTYFNRMIAWSGQEGEFNQLERAIAKLRSQLATPNPKSSFYEVGVSAVEDAFGDEPAGMGDGTAEMRIYSPGHDNRVMGFPCLSHISLKLFERRVHLTALYRNQHFIRKAYGNYLGLSRLLLFICREVGCEPGELVCISTHADAELSFGKGNVSMLVHECREALARGASNLSLV